MYDIPIEESGGPDESVSISSEPRNMKQISNRKCIINLEENRLNNTDIDNPAKLLQSYRNSQSFIRTETVTGASYITFSYTKKPRMISKSCVF